MNKIFLFHINSIPARVHLFITLSFSIFLFSCDKEIQNFPDSPPLVNPCPLGNFNGITVDYGNSRQDVDALGASLVHSWFHWDFIEPELKEPFVTIDEVTEEMIEAYSSGGQTGIDWSLTDLHINKYDGIDLLMGIGSGWKTDMPIFDGVKITPDLIGTEYYLGQLYLHVRSCVRRYQSKVSIWQIENEPNIAAETLSFGIRDGQSWADMNFVNKVLQTIKQAIKEEDSESLITINFHTDIHYQNEITEWIDLIDFVGIDAYPNYFEPDPIRSDSVITRVKKAIELSNGKPVVVTETGYSSGPPQSGYTEEKQEKFIQDVYSEIENAGGCGVLFFKLSTPEENQSTIFPQTKYGGLIKQDSTFKLGWYTLQSFLN